MLLQEPSHSPYDLRFQLLGFPVRIAWGFWLMSIIIGYNFVQGLDMMLRQLSPGVVPLLLGWTLCVFVSILIHELGHALAYRQYGIESSVVLYHFGGLAIPRGGRSYGNLGSLQSIWISFAGPFAQLVSAAILIVLVKFLGYRLDQFQTIFQFPNVLQNAIGADQGEPLLTQSVGLYALVDFFLFPSIFWAILNLIPVLPLDGGNITSSIVDLRGGSRQTALWISVIVSGLIVLYGFSNGDQYLAIMFIMFGISNYQQLQLAGR
ncbi:site-2 protease family protein [Rubripirellula reticaptiva]|uniref:Peptidase family M50 n=1 Tax=Rubripirellula reticaptiva TaxID=2528013 RepID=A0A5C6F8Y3_9BACT|nr:site-2 protease family protein [Rubripirellula reticaptiva]TWU57805.1 Peptidase family M50 [Rubripirellula reticaptiva]